MDVDDLFHEMFTRIWRREHVDGPDALAAIERARQVVTAAERDLDAAVATARSAGQSWEAIGRAAGMTRQSAHGRWAQPAGRYAVQVELLDLRALDPHDDPITIVLGLRRVPDLTRVRNTPVDLTVWHRHVGHRSRRRIERCPHDAAAPTGRRTHWPVASHCSLEPSRLRTNGADLRGSGDDRPGFPAQRAGTSASARSAMWRPPVAASPLAADVCVRISRGGRLGAGRLAALVGDVLGGPRGGAAARGGWRRS